MKKILFALCAAAVTMVACNKAEVASPIANDDARVVKFETQNLYSFDTKAVMGSGNVGIWAGSPINTNNASYTIDGTNLTGSSILWGIEQLGTTTPSYFFAKYPYNEGDSFTHSTGALAFAIRTDTGDHKTEDVAAALNYMVAGVKAAPGTGETPANVSFNFKHPFAKLVYKVTNSSDDNIRCATISGAAWAGTIDYAETEAAAPQVLTVTATPSATRTDGTEANNAYMNGGEWDETANAFVFYTITLPVASLSPSITIFMHSGAKYTYNVSSPINAEAGKIYTATINIDGTNNHSHITNNRVVTASFSETDWNSGDTPSLSAGSYTPTDTWYYVRGVNCKVGSTDANNWGNSLKMDGIGDGKYRVRITKTTASGTNMFFKVVKIQSGQSDVWFGKDEQSDDNGWQKYTNGGSDIEWGGDIDNVTTIIFDSVNSIIYVKDGAEVTR